MIINIIFLKSVWHKKRSAIQLFGYLSRLNSIKTVIFCDARELKSYLSVNTDYLQCT